MATLRPPVPSRPQPPGLNCGDLIVLQFYPSALPACHMPSTCPAGDPLLMPFNSWSGATPDFVALQAVRASVTGSDAGAYDPWPHPAPCHPSLTNVTQPGIVCDFGVGRVVGLQAAQVVGCPGCLWSGHPWWPVSEISQLTALRVLDLSNMNMQGGQGRGLLVARFHGVRGGCIVPMSWLVPQLRFLKQTH
jgi:hypothetical protein